MAQAAAVPARRRNLRRESVGGTMCVAGCTSFFVVCLMLHRGPFVAIGDYYTVSAIATPACVLACVCSGPVGLAKGVWQRAFAQGREYEPVTSHLPHSYGYSRSLGRRAAADRRLEASADPDTDGRVWCAVCETSQNGGLTKQNHPWMDYCWVCSVSSKLLHLSFASVGKEREQPGSNRQVEYRPTWRLSPGRFCVHIVVNARRDEGSHRG